MIKQKTPMREKSVILRIVVLALLLYSLASFASVQGKLRATEELAAELQLEREKLQAERQELEGVLLSLEDPAELQQLARQRLGMVMPGEKIFYFTTDREDISWGWK